MSKPVRISLDAMGGDHGPSVVVPGAALALERHPGMRFLMFGDEAAHRSRCSARTRCCKRRGRGPPHRRGGRGWTTSRARRCARGRGKSSMWQAIQAVRDGQADAAVSAGNTGALMAMAKFCLKTMAAHRAPGHRRPVADAARREHRARRRRHDRRRRRSISSTCASWAPPWRASFRPRAADGRPAQRRHRRRSRASRTVKEAGRILREADLPNLDYHGFVEGDDLGKGTVDVVVTEGFTGNIALKTAEGTAKQIARVPARGHEPHADGEDRLPVRPAGFDALREKMDPRRAERRRVPRP